MSVFVLLSLILRDCSWIVSALDRDSFSLASLRLRYFVCLCFQYIVHLSGYSPIFLFMCKCNRFVHGDFGCYSLNFWLFVQFFAEFIGFCFPGNVIMWLACDSCPIYYASQCNISTFQA